MRPRLLAFLLSLLVGCITTTPPIEPTGVDPLPVSASEWRVIDNVVLITDASGTMSIEGLLPRAKAVTQSLVGGMPSPGVPARSDTEYKVSLIGFGGAERVAVPLELFDRVKLLDGAGRLRPLGGTGALENRGGTTPLADVLSEASDSLKGQTGPAAVILIGDGRADDAAATVSAGRRLVDRYEDGVCIHAVHTGDSAEGRALLEALVALSTGGCGSFRAAESVTDQASVRAFSREVFLASAPAPEPPPVASAPPSACNGRLVLRGVQFELDRAQLRPESRPVLDFAAEVLRDCPNRNVVVEGHTCSLGSDAYNLQLSSRRAATVRAYLIDKGVAGDRLVTRGVGEAAPVASNDTEGGRAQNRRVELLPEND